MEKYRSVGGVYAENYNLSLDNEIATNGSISNIANKFTKTAGEHNFAQIDYNFEDATIDGSSVTFVLNALLKPETIDEINILDDTSRSISMFLKNASGENTDSVTQINRTAYFTQTNTWEELSFTFTADNLNDYDQMYIIFASGYSSPIDENGEVLDEDLVYYFDLLKSDVKCELCEETLSNDSNEFEDTVLQFSLYPNPVLSTFSTNNNSLIQKIEVFDVLGIRVKEFESTQELYSIEDLDLGVYFVKLTSFTGKAKIVRVLKKY